MPTEDPPRAPPTRPEADGRPTLTRLQGLDRSQIGPGMLYLAGSDTLRLHAASGSLHLHADEWLGSGTLRNSFFVEPWARLTRVRDLWLVLDAQGSMRVRVMQAALGQPAAVRHEFTIDSVGRQQVVQPLGAPSDLPEGSRLFWHIDAIEGAVLYDAAWSTRARPAAPMRLAVLIRTFGRTDDVHALLARFADASHAPHYAGLLERIDFWVLDTSADAESRWHLAPPLRLNLKVCSGPNLGGGGNASQLLKRLLDSVEADAPGPDAPTEVLLLDDDLSLSMESLARYFMFVGLRDREFVCSLPVLMRSQPHQVWEDGGFWGRMNYHEQGGFSRHRNLAPHLLKHGLSMAGFEHLDQFGPLNHCEYSTFIFFGLSMKTLRRLGLPAAFFLRGDDIEYSLRAQALGVPVLTNPNLAAWHEPGHSYAQEHMAILHAVLINLSYSEGDASTYARWFEARMFEHASINDLQGVELYLGILQALLDPQSTVLTARFVDHYRGVLPRLNAVAMTSLPEADRGRLEQQSIADGSLVLPFLYPGMHKDAQRHRNTILFNPASHGYRELPHVDCADRLALMQRFVGALQQWNERFTALQVQWQHRLKACAEAAFWDQVLSQHNEPQRELMHVRFSAPAAPCRQAGADHGSAQGDGGPTAAVMTAVPAGATWEETALRPGIGASPLRELRLRYEQELQALIRLRGSAEAAQRQPGVAPRASRNRAGHWLRTLWEPFALGGGAGRQHGRPREPMALPGSALPHDFDPAQYLALNADVARTGIDARAHYQRFGKAEGRRYKL